MRAKSKSFFGIPLFGLSAAQGSAEEGKVLALHFDAHEALLTSDQATEKTIQDNIRRALAGKFQKEGKEDPAELMTHRESVQLVKTSKKQVFAKYRYAMPLFRRQDPIQVFLQDLDYVLQAIQKQVQPLAFLIKIYIFLKMYWSAVQDNWEEWKTFCPRFEFSKIVPLDLKVQHTTSLFFDDSSHVELNSEKNAVALVNAPTGWLLPFSALVDICNFVVSTCYKLFRMTAISLNNSCYCFQMARQKRLELPAAG